VRLIHLLVQGPEFVFLTENQSLQDGEEIVTTDAKMECCGHSSSEADQECDDEAGVEASGCGVCGGVDAEERG